MTLPITAGSSISSEEHSKSNELNLRVEMNEVESERRTSSGKNLWRVPWNILMCMVRVVGKRNW